MGERSIRSIGRSIATGTHTHPPTHTHPADDEEEEDEDESLPLPLPLLGLRERDAAGMIAGLLLAFACGVVGRDGCRPPVDSLPSVYMGGCGWMWIDDGMK